MVGRTILERNKMIDGKELTVLGKILDDIFLGLELPFELVGVHISNGPLLRLLLLAFLHIRCCC